MSAKSAPSRKLTLLLAEDNPHVSALLQRALASLAEITTVTDGADALLRAAESHPDIVVADFTLPGLDGFHLLEKLRSRAPTRELGYVLMAPKSDLEQLPRVARELADEVIEKPFLVADAAAVIRRVIARVELQRTISAGTKAGAGPTDDSRMRGRLSQLSLVDLLQALELGGKTCQLTVRHIEKHCDITIDRGAVLHARSADSTGDEAVFQALSWPDGVFEIDFSLRVLPARNVQRSTQALLMDGLRLLDEARHAAAEAGRVLDDL